MSHDGNRFQSRLFIKPIHSNSILHWNSHCPVSTKRGTLLGELSRADRRSTSSESVHYSRDLIVKRFALNGYPKRFIERAISAHKRKATHVDGVGTSEENKLVSIKCPYIDEESKRKYLALFRRIGIMDYIRPWFDGGKSLRKQFHPPKERVQCKSDCKFCAICSRSNLCNRKNVIYKIKCNMCDKLYIGQTHRHISSRINEHIFLKSDSAVREHFTQDHPGICLQTNVEWDLLRSGVFHYHKRLVLESMYIGNYSSDHLMNGCKGVNIKSF